MKTIFIKTKWRMLLALALASAVLAPAVLRAEVRVRVSIKAILGPNDEWPNNSGGSLNLNSEQAVRDNITFTNDMLAAQGYPFRLSLHNNTVYTLTGMDDPWYTVPARSSTTRNDIEDAALADKTTWKWHDNAINIYLNDTSSGWCSSPAGGRSVITIGARSYNTLIIHEIGHFLSLGHTHSGDGDGDLNDWADGDGFSETLADEADASDADINNRYPGETQATRDNLIRNIMSYHTPQDIFVWQQRQAIIETINGARDAQASGEGFFVRDDGNDFFNGKTYATRVNTLQRAVDLSTSSNDVILIRGTQDVANGSVFSKPQTWMKWRSNALIR